MNHISTSTLRWVDIQVFAAEDAEQAEARKGWLQNLKALYDAQTLKQKVLVAA